MKSRHVILSLSLIAISACVIFYITNFVDGREKSSNDTSIHTPLEKLIPAESRQPEIPPAVDSWAIPLSETQRTCRDDLRYVLSKHPDLKISAKQLDDLLEAYSTIFDERLTYEAAHAKISTIPSTGETVIDIPAYAEHGSTLRGRLINSFRSILGSDLAEQTWESLITFIEAHNSRWGRYPQQTVISYNKSNGYYDYFYSLDPLKTGGARIESSGTLILPHSVYPYEKYIPRLNLERKNDSKTHG